MGLDASVFRLSKRAAISPVKIDYEFKQEEVYYWRKFWALQYWMRNLYKKKGGTEKDFNNDYVQLTEEDLDRLKEDCKDFDLSEVLFEQDLENLPEVIEKLKANIDSEHCVYYWCSY